MTNNYKSIIERVDSLLDGLTPQEQAIAISRAQSQVKKYNADRYDDKEQHLTWKIADAAYKHILDHNVTAKEALTKAAVDFEEEIEKVLEEKTKYSGKMSGTIVKNNDSHPVQVDMVKKGKFNRQSLKNSNNIWQALNLLKDFRQAYEDLLKLEDAIQRIDLLESEMFLVKDDVKSLKNIVKTDSKTDSEKAVMMYDNGFKYRQIADVLGVKERTIRYWVTGY